MHSDGVDAWLYLAHPDGRNAVHRFSPRIFDAVCTVSWSHSNGYAQGTLSGVGVTRLHWMALGVHPGRGKTIHVDHKNRDRSDSRDENLIYPVTPRENLGNKSTQSSVGRGVVLFDGRYSVSIFFGGNRVFHPGFTDIEAAYRCRDEYLQIAEDLDNGTRGVPSKAELKAISDRIRNA